MTKSTHKTQLATAQLIVLNIIKIEVGVVVEKLIARCKLNFDEEGRTSPAREPNFYY